MYEGGFHVGRWRRGGGVLGEQVRVRIRWVSRVKVAAGYRGMEWSRVWGEGQAVRGKDEVVCLDGGF